MSSITIFNTNSELLSVLSKASNEDLEPLVGYIEKHSLKI